jgi:hypothetical protein
LTFWTLANAGMAAKATRSIAKAIVFLIFLLLK